MAFDTSQFFNKPSESGAAVAEPLVNQKQSSFTDQFFDPQPEPPKKPESLFGEFTGAFGRGLDELEAMGYGAGALTASWLGAEDAKQWFMKGYAANMGEAEKNPETVKSLGDAKTFDDYLRYGVSAVGGFAPMVFQGLAASAIGGLIGSAAEPGGGTIAGGVTGLVARNSVKKLLATEAKQWVSEGVAAEISSYLEGKVAKSELSAMAQGLLTKQGEVLAEQYGGTALAGVSNAAIMSGAFYGEMANNPDIPESDRKIAATVGGILASIPMTTFAGTISKAFAGKEVTEAMLQNPAVRNEVAEQTGYFARFLTTGAKEMAKSFGHMGAAMFTQTAIQIAASKWADPNTRWEFLNYTPAEWQSMLDSAVKGGIGSLPFGFAAGVARTPFSEHPDPAVRSDMRDIKMMADDVPIVHPDVTPEHRELSELQKQADAIRARVPTMTGDEANLANSDLMKHEARIEELKKKLGFVEEEKAAAGGGDETLVNQKKEEAPAPKKESQDQIKIEELKKATEEPLPREKVEELGLDKGRVAVQNKQADIDTHIESIAGGTDYGKALKSEFTPAVVDMMAAENVHVTSDKNPDGFGWATDVDKNGNVVIYVPDGSSKEATKSMNEKDGVRVAMGHELTHVSDFINLRNEWKAGDQSVPVREYIKQKLTERGARMRQAEPSLPKVVFSGYRRGEVGAMSDLKLGQELPRMAVEFGRQGRTSEVTEALHRAAQKDNKINAFFRDWIDALKTVHGFIKKMINPQTGNPELIKAYNDINATLDKYGVLVNEKPGETPTTSPEPKIAGGGEILPSQAAPMSAPVASPPPAAAAPAEAKGPTPYQRFREAIRTERGPSEVANKYLAFLKSKKKLPQTKAEIDAAHIDLVNRHKGFTMSRERFRDLANQYIKDEIKTQSQQGKSELAAEKARIGDDESGDTAERDERVSGERGGTDEYHTRIAQDVSQASKQAKRGKKLESIRAHIAENHPYISSHLENIIGEVSRNISRASEAAHRWTAPARPARGIGVADAMRHFQYALWVPSKVREASVKLGEERGIAITGPGLDVPEGHYLIDTQPDPLLANDPMIDHRASMQPPVEITNKLDEALLTKGIPETYPIVDGFGTSDMSLELLKAFDDHFGENNWIVKSFAPDAAQSNGVMMPKALKQWASMDHEAFAKSDLTNFMVQKLHPIDTTGSESNVKIKSGQELRVHILTNMEGGADVLPFATFWKLTQDEARVTPASKLTPIMIEDAPILDAHAAALEAIRSLPESDRLGQFYGLDMIRTNDGGWGVVELNPSSHGGSSGFFQDSALAHESYLAALMGDRPVHAELANEVHKAATEDAMVNRESLVNERIDIGEAEGIKEDPMAEEPLAAEIPRMSKNDEEYLANKIARDWLAGTQRILDRNKTLAKDDPWNLPPANLSSQFENILASYYQPGEILEGKQFTKAAADRILQGAIWAAKNRMRMDQEKYKDVIAAFTKPVEPQIREDLAAEIPKLSPQMEARLDAALDDVKDRMGGAFEDVTIARRRLRERGGKADTRTITPQEMEYRTQPQGEAILKAREVLENNKTRDVIEYLDENVVGSKYELNAHDELDGSPTAGVVALYQALMQHMDVAAGDLEAKGKDRTAQIWLRKKFANLEANLRRYLTAIGRATSISGKIDKVFNGYVARNAYVEPILAHLEKALGPKGARFIRQMGDQLNELIGNEAGRAVMSPEVIAHLQNILEASKTEKFKKEARKTYTATDKKARQMVQTMASRLAAHMSMDEVGPEHMEAIAQRMVKKLQGLPVSDEREVESKIFHEAIKQVFSDNAKKIGLIPDSEAKGTTIESKFAAIMKNPEMYDEFAGEITRRMMNEYKPEEGSPFHEQMTELAHWMHSRAWSDGMVDSLVNKNMRELQMRFGKLAREKFDKSENAMEEIKERVRAVMAEKGVDNEGLLDQLMEDLEASFTSRAEQARLDFFGSGQGVRDLLTSMQTNLAAKAKEHATSARIHNEDIRHWLSHDFGLPDTKEMPIASSLADVMNRQYNEMLGAKREEIVKNMVKNASEGLNPNQKAKAMDSVDKILKLVNLGVFRDETAYNALAPKFGLPKYNEDIARQAEQYGEFIATAPNLRMVNQAKQELAMLIASQRGIKPYDMFLAGLYVNYLSGISTSAVNIQSNAASLAGYFATAATQDIVTNRGRNVPAMFRALVRAATGSAKIEAADALMTGHTLHSSGEKFFVSHNVMEMENPVFTSKFSIGNDAMDQFARGIFERAAAADHKLYRRLGGKWVGRALNAQDVYFYKIAQEVAFAAKTGIVETQQLRSSAMMEAEQQMRQMGWDPNSSKEMKRKQEVMANHLVNEKRITTEAQRIAWNEARDEALDATFRQDPKGLLGKASKMIEKWTQGEEDSPNPVGRMLIPFTRIAANVTNQMLEWTPYGLIRYGIGHTFGEDFRLRDESGKTIGRDPKVLIRATLGTLGGMTLMALFGKDADDKDPFFAVYDDGSKNPQKRRQMMDAGWRPKTIKVGRGYYSYTGTPFSMAFSIMGRLYDDYRDGASTSPYDVGLSSAAVAMLQAVTHESFLSSLTDFMSAVDSPNPESKMSRLMSRAAIAPFVPNLAKQVDKWVNPNVQQAQGFWESFIREIPYARTTLMPAVNIFGEKISRDPGINFPGMERFLTMQRTDDPVYNLLSEKRMVVPGFSKSTKLGNEVMTRDQYYQYVVTAGPEVKKAIQAHMAELQGMDREHAQEMINELARKVKERARDAMRNAAKSS